MFKIGDKVFVRDEKYPYIIIGFFPDGAYKCSRDLGYCTISCDATAAELKPATKYAFGFRLPIGNMVYEVGSVACYKNEPWQDDTIYNMNVYQNNELIAVTKLLERTIDTQLEINERKLAIKRIEAKKIIRPMPKYKLGQGFWLKGYAYHIIAMRFDESVKTYIYTTEPVWAAKDTIMTKRFSESEITELIEKKKAEQKSYHGGLLSEAFNTPKVSKPEETLKIGDKVALTMPEGIKVPQKEESYTIVGINNDLYTVMGKYSCGICNRKHINLVKETCKECGRILE